MTEASSNHQSNSRPKKDFKKPFNSRNHNNRGFKNGSTPSSRQRSFGEKRGKAFGKGERSADQPKSSAGQRRNKPSTNTREDWKSGFGSKPADSSVPRTTPPKPSRNQRFDVSAKEKVSQRPENQKTSERKGFAGRPSRPKRSSSRATPARLVALEATRTIRERNAYAQEIINHTVDHSSLSPEDRAFATRLVLGVVSTQGALDYVIDKTLDDPKDISPQVRDALRISTYEILFLDKLYHAAVDQGVELVKSVAPPAAGVANYALRSIVRMRPDFPFGDPRTDLDALSLLYGFPAWMTILLMSDLGPETMLGFMKE